MKHSKEFKQFVRGMFEESVREDLYGLAIFDFTDACVYVDDKSEYEEDLLQPLNPANYTPNTHKLLGKILRDVVLESRGCIALLQRAPGVAPRVSPEDMEYTAAALMTKGLGQKRRYKGARALFLEAGFRLIDTQRRPGSGSPVLEIWSLSHEK